MLRLQAVLAEFNAVAFISFLPSSPVPGGLELREPLRRGEHGRGLERPLLLSAPLKGVWPRIVGCIAATVRHHQFDVVSYYGLGNSLLQTCRQ